MRDDCTAFLQWALPKMHMRWQGFRRVRSQVCKRISRRVGELDLDGFEHYREYLEAHPHEWSVLDALCRITISRFWRDSGVFDALRDEVLPELARAADACGDDVVRCWSCGCASGEEPYSLEIVWQMAVARNFPDTSLEIIASDSDPRMLERARRAVYPLASTRDLPHEWRHHAFDAQGDDVVLRAAYRESTTWLCQDVRTVSPAGPFDLIMCRNLVFTYYEEPLQYEIARRLLEVLRLGGALVVGSHEKLPSGFTEFEPWLPHLSIYRRKGDSAQTQKR